MTEPKFTKGPWRVEDGTTLIWGDCNPDDTTSYGMGYPIAECRLTPSASWAKGPKAYSEAEANARLIAAAPQMYEALEKVAFHLRANPSPSLADKLVIDLCAATLSAATGESEL